MNGEQSQSGKNKLGKSKLVLKKTIMGAGFAGGMSFFPTFIFSVECGNIKVFPVLLSIVGLNALFGATIGAMSQLSLFNDLMLLNETVIDKKKINKKKFY